MIRKISAICMVLLCLQAAAQISNAKVTFERKTNLYKKFKNEQTRRWIKEEDKIKIDYFELFVTDTFSLFKPVESELRENYAWATSKNSVYQDLKNKKSYTVKMIWGEELHLTDTLRKRIWHISESTRKIAGYTCRKAIWHANDSTRIYAWFSYDLVPSTGPESFNGLPGLVLGLATEDGGVVYFAKKVEILKPEPVNFVLPKKKKIYSVEALKKQLTEEYGKEKWFNEMLHENFVLW